MFQFEILMTAHWLDLCGEHRLENSAYERWPVVSECSADVGAGDYLSEAL